MEITKVGYYPINICSVPAPTLLSVLISIPPESLRLSGKESTKGVTCPSCKAREGGDGLMSVRAVTCRGKVQAAGEATEQRGA